MPREASPSPSRDGGWASLAARYSERVRYGLWPSDSPEQLRCDGGEMLPQQKRALAAQVRRRHSCWLNVLELSRPDRPKVVRHVSARRHPSMGHDLIIAPRAQLIAKIDQGARTFLAQIDACMAAGMG